jgi:hypothetical protein
LFASVVALLADAGVADAAARTSVKSGADVDLHITAIDP